MLVEIKPHSSLQQYFRASSFKADLNYYIDIHEYIRSMHPKFTQYIKQLQINSLNESYTLLDRNLKEITPDELFLRKAKENDVIHIVPAIIGGGGKRGGILAALALVAFFVFLPPLAGTGLLGAQAATVAGSVGTGISLSSSVAILKGSSMLSTLVLNVGLAIISSLFMSEPEAGEETRQNDMFGSLSNTTRVGTPVALNYGMIRAAGQFISGYIDSISHGKTDEVSVLSTIYNYVEGDRASTESKGDSKGVSSMLLGDAVDLFS